MALNNYNNKYWLNIDTGTAFAKTYNAILLLCLCTFVLNTISVVIIAFIIHPCDLTVVICYLIWPCGMAVHIRYLISHNSSLSSHTVIKYTLGWVCIPLCVNVIHLTSLGFSSWCPQSIPPVDSCFQGIAVKTSLCTSDYINIQGWFCICIWNLMCVLLRIRYILLDTY